MTHKGTKGRRQVNLDLPADLIESMDDLAARMGRSRTEEVILAMKRHLAFPPSPPSDAPLDPLPEAKGQKKPGKRKGG